MSLLNAASHLFLEISAKDVYPEAVLKEILSIKVIHLMLEHPCSEPSELQLFLLEFVVPMKSDLD